MCFEKEDSPRGQSRTLRRSCKYESIKKCKLCYIYIKNECDLHKDYLLEKYDEETLKKMKDIRIKINELSNELKLLED